MGEHGAILENRENMEKMETINQIAENTLFLIQNTFFVTQNTLFVSQMTQNILRHLWGWLKNPTILDWRARSWVSSRLQHTSYSSQPAVVYFFQAGILFSIKNTKFWPILANFGYFVPNLHAF